MEQTMTVQVVMLLLSFSMATNAQTLGVTSTVAIPSIPLELLPTIPPTTTGRVPLQPGKFSPCWGTTITNSITWDVFTTTFTNITVIPHVTPFADGTNVTSYETLAPQGPAPTHFLSTTMADGSVCVVPTPCVEKLAQGCGSLRERQLFVGLDSTGSAGSTPFTNPSTYITATSIIDTAYTAPPRIEPRVDPTSTSISEGKQPSVPPKPSAPQPPPSPTSTQDTPSDNGNNGGPGPVASPTRVQSQSSVRIVPPVKPSEATISAIEANFPGNSRPVSETVPVFTLPSLPGPTRLPNGFSILPSQPGVVLPNGETLQPGSATTVGGVEVSLAPSESFIAIGNQGTIPIGSTPTALPNGFSILPSGSGVVLPNGQTLEPGAATIINGIPVSLSPSESFIAVEGSKTIPLVPAVTNGVVLPNGQTLQPGVLTTILGVPVSLSPDETAVVIDDSTIALASTAKGGIGSYVWSGIGAEATASAGSDGDDTPSSSTSGDATSPQESDFPGGASMNICEPAMFLVVLVGLVQLWFWP
ncbi:hypothetical protein BU23DRAFT_528462 [Bimuria novae-zelandiae CBS 107.79]|uniref:Uncharacterized protein n=1 Tax=Bimuria novae-zelandiae CBS 107.79 TaxID=1447943 RepID=A0A6A5VJ58_9PLEO|nr:hypothetical protein BU23DRAFT_528462 [Bimuria novae-zelandiae CBS 107.79]